MSTETIRTDLRVKIQDAHSNDWHSLGLSDINPELAYFTPFGTSPYAYDQGYWEYRGQAAMVKLSDRIVRVRIGDGSATDRQLYKQEITDPLDPDQWESWSLLYSGDHFAVCAYVSSDAIQVVHSKSDGVYLNNNLRSGVSNAQGVISLTSVVGQPTMIYASRVSQDADGQQQINNFVFPNIVANGNMVEDLFNYRYPSNQVAAIKINYGADFLFRVRAAPYYSPSARSPVASDDLVMEYTTFDNSQTELGDTFPIISATGRAGKKRYTNLRIYNEFSDHRIYLFFTERHTDKYHNNFSNLHAPLFWMSSGFLPDGTTEPMPIGSSVWGFAGAVEWGNYIIIAGNGSVHYRSRLQDQLDLSNYAISASLKIPRGNERATGTVTLANPSDVVGRLLQMTDGALSSYPEKRVRISIGQYRNSEDDWEYAEVDDWWISSIHRINNEKQNDNTNRIVLNVADFWHRLENPFRDVRYWPGRMRWEDLKPSGANVLDNYASPDGSELTLEDYMLGDEPARQIRVGSGILLNTLWKGTHGRFQAWLDGTGSDTKSVLFRYVDQKNYYEVRYSPSNGNLQLRKCINGTNTSIITKFVGTGNSSSLIEVEFRGRKIRVWYDYGLEIDQMISVDDTEDFTGFVGVMKTNDVNWTTSQWSFQDFEVELTTSSLIKILLNFCGYSQFSVPNELNDTPWMSVAWGPQMDVTSPADGIKKLLETNFMQIACSFREDAPQLGFEIKVSQFEEQEAEYIIKDEIISVDQIDDSESRPNIILVDGNEDSWTEYYRSDLVRRAAPVNKYLDLPQLDSLIAVRNKAQEEKAVSVKGSSLGGLCVWRPWFRRMDTVQWIDQFGNTYDARIEGMDIDIDQGAQPFQHVQMDLTPVIICDPEEETPDDDEDEDNPEYIVYDDFDRDPAAGTWGGVEIGGDYAYNSGNMAQFSLDGSSGVIQAPASGRYAYLPDSVTSSALYVSFSCQYDILPIGSQVIAGPIVRGQDVDNFYFWIVRIYPDRTVAVAVAKRISGANSTIHTYGKVISNIPATNGKVFFKGWIGGSDPARLSHKVWMGNAELEPDTWANIVTDTQPIIQSSGFVGLRLGGTTGLTNSPKLKIDDFIAVKAPVSSPE